MSNNFHDLDIQERVKMLMDHIEKTSKKPAPMSAREEREKRIMNKLLNTVSSTAVVLIVVLGVTIPLAFWGLVFYRLIFGF